MYAGIYKTIVRQKVLVIDDEKDLCSLIIRVLSTDDYQTDCAHSLQDGKFKWELGQPDIVLLDNNLPDGTALGFLEENRHLLQEAIVILITADTEFKTNQTAGRLGIPFIIHKPFTMTEIRHRINSITE